MDKINTTLTNNEKLEIGKKHAHKLINKYDQIESIYMFGSTVRGDSIPISDLDFHYLIHKGESLEIEGGIIDGVYFDIDADYIEDLSVESVLSDGYLYGLFKDSVIVHDKHGLIQSIKEAISQTNRDEHKKDQLSGLRNPLERNLKEFTQAVVSDNKQEICRASGFYMWCLSDYLLAKYNRSAGGFRTLARLKTVNNDAFISILLLQDSINFSANKILEFYNILSSPIVSEKVLWMIDNGFKDEAFHSIWINFGLEIKEKKVSDEELDNRCKIWLDLLEWNPSIQRKKIIEMQQILKEYVEED